MDFMDKVSEFSKKVGEGAEKTYKAVADKSGKIFKETQLKLDINNKENDIELIYFEMGKEVYEEHKKGNETGADFEKACKKIDKMLKEIEELEKNTLYLRKLRKCTNCGEVIEIENKYCPKCGDKQKKVKIKEEKKEEVVEEKPLDKICPDCGRLALDDEVFCTECGYKFD